MFASKDLFDTGDEVDIDASGNAEYQSSRPMTSAQASSTQQPPQSASASSSSSSSSAGIYAGGQTFDRAPSGNFASSLGAGQLGNLNDLPASTPTPAMRKAKMEEMRRAHLDKRKAKAMAQPTVLRANQDQLKTGPAAAAATATPGALSPTGALSPSFSKQPSYDKSKGSMPQPGEYTPNAGGPAARDSDDEDGAAIGVDGNNNNHHSAASASSMDFSSSNMNHLLAEKRAEKERRNISQAERDMMEQGIAPVFDPVKPVIAPGVKLDFSDMRSFLINSVPKGMNLQCYILRNKKGLKNKIYPTYEAYISGEERFLLAARKRMKNKTSNYMISMDKNNITSSSKESASYLGKVRSNFVGTEFVGYDKGLNPKDLDAESASISLMSVRQELCAVFYESNILGSKGPRKMTAVVPSVKKGDSSSSGSSGSSGTKQPWKPLKPEDSILERYKAAPSHSDFMSLVNKTPKWNDSVGAYVLNFNGRVTQASVKNFQLIHVDDPETVILQFGRIGKDTFTMDFQYPLSPLQAFQICLTSFDYKFACE